MIISASRRTDIAAFYAQWLSRRLRAGFCTVPNPFNPKQVTRISLEPKDVDALVIWTRNPRPLLPFLEEFDSQGYRYYFQFTILNYPRQIDPKLPPVESVIESFQILSRRLGPARVVWRYDPIVFTKRMSPSFHRENFQYLAEALGGYTHRSVISLVDIYRKIEGRLQTLAGTRDEVGPCAPEHLAELMPELVRLAQTNGMDISSCSEERGLQSFGIPPGKCIDDDLLTQAFGLQVPPFKDPGQRPACRCVVSKDIGMYDSCLHGCIYCYATGNTAGALRHFRRHDPLGSSLFS